MTTYLQWDYETSTVVSAPSNVPGETGDWLQCIMPEPKTSPAQELRWMLLEGTTEDYLTGYWESTLENEKLLHWENIKKLRSLSEVQPLLFDGNLYDADFVSQQRISGAVQLATLAPAEWTIDWTLANNSTLTLTKVQVISLGIALAQRTNDIYAYSRVIRESIDAAESIEDLNEIAWQFEP